MNWFAFSLLSITAVALAELTQQKLLNTKNHFDERTSGVLTFLAQAVFTIPIILFSSLKNSIFHVFENNSWQFMVINAFLASIAMVFYLRSFKVKNISFSSIFVSFSVVVSTALGIIFFHESTSIMKFFGTFLILAAIISANYKNAHLEKNHYYALIAGLIFGICYTIDKLVVTSTPPIVYIFWTFTFIAIFGTLLGVKTVFKSIKSAKISQYQPILISGAGYFAYNLCTFISYTLGGEVGRVDSINNSQVFLIILVEYFILKHKSGWLRKLITAGIAFAGVLVLGFF